MCWCVANCRPDADLYAAYRTWSEANGEQTVTQTKFGTILGERGFDREKGGTGRVRWFGIGVRE